MVVGNGGTHVSAVALYSPLQPAPTSHQRPFSSTCIKSCQDMRSAEGSVKPEDSLDCYVVDNIS
jgi:hypothetical protein